MNKNELKKEMLEAIFIKTGGRPENPEIAEICAEIAVKNCSIPAIVGRSEQLKAFMDFAEWYKDEYKQHIPLGAIKEYVKNL